MPPPMIHRQQQLQSCTIGSADNTPMKRPPSRNGIVGYAPSVVVFAAEVRDELLAAHKTQRVLQLHQLNEQIVLRIDLGGVHRCLEVEGKPFLDARHASPLRQVEKERGIEDDRRGENAVAAQEVDLQLHRIAEPAEDVDVVPPLFVVAARRIVVDADDMSEIVVELGIQMRLEDIVQS